MRRIRPFDIVAVVLAVSLTVVTAIAAYGGATVASRLRVQTPDGTHIYDLSRNATYEFTGPLGVTEVEISAGRVTVVSSPCREQICVNSPPLVSAGDWTACLPNRVFLEVTGDEDTEIDAISF